MPKAPGKDQPPRRVGAWQTVTARLASPDGQIALQLGRVAGKRAISAIWTRLAQGRHALLADAGGEVRVLTAGPHWIRVPARRAIRLLLAPQLVGTAPAFQVDPALPLGSVRILYQATYIDLENYNARAAAVFLTLIQPDTAQDLTLLAQAVAAAIRKDPP